MEHTEDVNKAAGAPSALNVGLADACSENIFKALCEIRGDWIHGDTFLPANVLCDYAGERGMINLMSKIIAETLAVPNNKLTH